MIVMTVFLSIFISIFCIGYFTEKYEYNNGICRKNGLPWEYFDSDNQGGRGYKSGNEYCWISYPFIDSRSNK